MTFLDLKADIYRRLRYSAAPPTDVSTRVAAFLNETHRELLSLPGMERLREDVIPVTATANVARSGLPPVVARIRAVVDRTNNHKIPQVPLSALRLIDPGQVSQGGIPSCYAEVGYRAVQFQPLAATGIWAVSTVAGDTTQDVYFQSRTTGGYAYSDLKRLNGTTRVAIGATVRTDHEEVTRFYLSAVAAGYISLYTAASGGTELARIEPGKTSQHYLTLEWYPIQTTDLTLYVDHIRNIPDLVQDFDEPLLPPDLHYVVGLGARVKEYELIDDSRIAQARSDFLRGQAVLRSYVLNDGDGLASLRGRRTHGNAFGGNYPDSAGGSGWIEL